MTYRRLLPLDAFAPIFEPLQGRRVGLVTPYGNVGDTLIGLATEQLLDEFKIDWGKWDEAHPNNESFDELLFGGGGNMGTRYRNNWELRNRVFETGLPVTILPQSFNSEELRSYKKVWVRETVSKQYCPDSELAPDLALGLKLPLPPPPKRRLGIFLRKDRERSAGLPWLRRDPAKMCDLPSEYFNLAATYNRIITDRLHFAICGLLAGREVTLLPNDYHKNRAMHQTWLRSLGCQFAENWFSALLRSGKAT